MIQCCMQGVTGDFVECTAEVQAQHCTPTTRTNHFLGTSIMNRQGGMLHTLTYHGTVRHHSGDCTINGFASDICVLWFGHDKILHDALQSLPYCHGHNFGARVLQA